uniref:Transposase n=1 Tax=Gongylonema pulchrum TaxID=637853 RepID=A0A183DPE7_9BILA
LLRRLAKLEQEVEEYREEIRILNGKLNSRKYDCGAVAVLRDKLMAKEKLIEQQVR